MVSNFLRGRCLQDCSCLLLLTIALAAWPLTSPEAATGPWATGGTVRARLVGATNAAGADNQIHAGLQVNLDEGWDTYWRSPGDAGAAPEADWSASTNVASVDWRWPAPTRFVLLGLETFGYVNEVVFPLIVHAARPGEPVALRGKLDILVCRDICIPNSLDISLDMPAGAPTDAEATNLIARYEARVPGNGSLSGLRVDGVTAVQGNPASLIVEIASREPLVGPEVLVESSKWTFGKPTFSWGTSRRTATARLPVTSGPDAVGLPLTPVTVTVVDGARASETSGTVRPSTEALDVVGWASMLPFVGTAMLGGLVLNLMPCVLPVLGLKLMAVLRYQGRARREVRLGFLAAAVGAIASMLALGGALAGLKAAGLAVGWGMQFQQPAFLTVMAVALAVFAANLAGLFEFRLPSRLANAMGGADRSGVAGNFAVGAFTTVLATPCSAPFVGTAVGFALARGPVEILAIFGGMGAGLATPHLLGAAFPRLIRFLPKSGRWMVALRRVLALTLAGTAVWLLAVLGSQASWTVAGGVAAAIAAIAGALVLRSQIGVAAVAAIVALAVLGAGTAPFALHSTAQSLVSAAWEPFDEGVLRRQVSEGKTVFVDVTAGWCVNCKANEVLALAHPEVRSALDQPGVVSMRADWTRPDGRISDYLARNDRYAIPFNAVYGPGEPRGIVLSESLTRNAVLDALRRARGADKLSSR